MADNEEKAGLAKEIPVEAFGAGVAKLITDGVSGVLGAHGTEKGGFLAGMGRDLGALLRKVEVGLRGGEREK
jgi:hypothetical protein